MEKTERSESTQPRGAPSRRRDLMAVVIVAFLGLLLGLNLFFFFDSRGPGIAVGDVAPDFELPVMGSEETVQLSDYRGQVVAMDFWATWCPPCKEQMPALEAVAADPAFSEDVIIFSINTDQESEDRQELMESFLADAGLSLPTLIDDGTVRGLYRVSAIPTLVIVDPRGRINHVSQGLHDEARLRSLIDRAR